MRPFFYSKYDIPANSLESVSISFLSFVLFIPPKATVLSLVSLDIFLNLFKPK